ncbi:FAD-binding monooxygenase [Dactylosporangium matsuzakiense]|uniref:FAD-binding monooxygenase n=2 Tax=Dactylosporangium matsuzakiense TaxID=53360 RepID=A0A9W6KHW8_9ACTN|nr:FAD-binding monooxygenase [Dactylosporangium matsuzakiense]
MGMTHAIVLGAGISGLLAARALSEGFDRVSVFDRDDLAGSGPRKGVPQGRHAHAMLAKGLEVLEELFPGLTGELTAAGAVPVDIHGDFAWHNGPNPMARARSGLTVLCLSRPALEDYLRGRVAKLPGVEVHGGRVATGLLTNADRSVVTGARVDDEHVTADLVVDATGRGNRAPAWLAGLGYAVPVEESVHAGIVYATREFERGGVHPPSLGVLTGMSPAFPFGVALLPQEGDRWIMTLCGLAGDAPPIDAEGFAAYATRLGIADVADVVFGAPPVTEPRAFRVPASVRRRFERLERHPRGFLAFGDALCAFNPIYGQGMTVAAQEALVLRTVTDPAKFYAAAAKVIDTPWEMAVGGDLAFPSVPGRRTLKVRILNRYLARVLRAAEHHPEVALAFHRVVNLVAPPGHLFSAPVLRRVLH